MGIGKVLIKSNVVAVVILLSLTLSVVRSQEESTGEVFEMEEVSVFDIRNSSRISRSTARPYSI